MKCANPECGKDFYNKRSTTLFCSRKCCVKIHYQKNRNEYIQRSKKRRIENKQTISKEKRKAYQANREYYLVKQREYRLKNKDKYKDYLDNYYQSNRDYLKNKSKILSQQKRDLLDVSYIKERFKKLGIVNPTLEMIDQKILTLKITRKIKELQK